MRLQRTLLLVLGAVLALIGVGLLAGGGALVAIHATQRDGDGYYTSSRHLFETPTRAITSERLDLDLDVDGAGWIDDGIGTARLDVRRDDGGPVFVGIGAAQDVDAYLDAVAHDHVVDVTRGGRARYERATGELAPEPPADQPFWAASTEGPGAQRVRWEVTSGDWTVVAMNADGSAGVYLEARVGLRTGILLPIGLGLLGGAVVIGALGALAMVAGLRKDGADTSPSVATAPSGAYPVRLRGELDPTLSRWLWLVKWFLAIPHVFALALLWPVAVLLTVAAGFSILFTGRYPRSIFDFNVGVMRWTWRVTFYAFTFGTDRYPPFQLDRDPYYPADLEVDPPQALSRGLVLVKWWLLALPHYLVLAVFGGGFTWWAWGSAADGRLLGGAGLIGILAFVAGVCLLFTSRYPQSIFDFVMGMQRWTYRVLVYAALMRDEYPPFRLDPGGPDPGSRPPSRAAAGHDTDAVAA